MIQNKPNSVPSISVVTITWNEEAAVKKVVNDLRKVIGESEIIVVDSSTDKTAEIAESLGCKVIKQLPPRGYGVAYDAGFKAAAGDIIITLDCDDTYPAHAIPDLVNKIQQGFDLVSASRLKNRPNTMPLENYLANWLFAFFARIICGIKSTDVHTGMRAYRKSMLKAFPYQAKGMALPVELQVGPASLGYKCTEIFIDYHLRIGETKLKRVESTIWTLRRIWKWRFFFNKERSILKRTLMCLD